jgi:hypothetical protein
MNGVGQWRCYLGWMLIHTVMTTSPITRSRLRQGTGEREQVHSVLHIKYPPVVFMKAFLRVTSLLI